MKKKLLDPYRNIGIRELIGLEVKIVNHPDTTFQGSRGTIIDETRNMFLVRMEGKDRKVSKKGGRFEVIVNGPRGRVVIELIGDDLLVRPEDRTKKLERRRPPSNRMMKDRGPDSVS